MSLRLLHLASIVPVALTLAPLVAPGCSAGGPAPVAQRQEAASAGSQDKDGNRRKITGSVTTQWTTIAPMPGALEFPSSTPFGGTQVMVLGGDDDGSPLSVVYA